MPLLNSNPTQTDAWKKLTSHFEEMGSFSIQNAFADNSNRKQDFSIQFNDLNVDYSKNRINETTMKLLVELAEELELKDAIDKYFSGDKINVTEGRAVLHTALRSNSEEPLLVDGKDIKPHIKKTLRKIRIFSESFYQFIVLMHDMPIFGRWIVITI